MGMPPYPATAIATWFISRASAGEPEPSSLKLDTLLGRAQGHYRARYGRPLLAEPTPAYPSGNPVAEPAGTAARTSGARLTGPQTVDAIPGHDIDPATASFLGEVWDSYSGCFAEVKLVIPAACTGTRLS
jgi:uncharacterized phage-associated protein